MRRLAAVPAALVAVAALALLWIVLTPEGPSIVVEDPWVRPAPMGAAGYMVISNRGGEADTLLSVSVDFGSAMLHETVMDGDVMKMRPVKELEIPPRSEVELKPGGYHIMLQDLERPLQEGEVVSLRLHFQRSGIITLSVPVSQEAPGGEG